MTLDETQDAFRNNRTIDTMVDYLEALQTYFADAMIGPDTLEKGLREIKAFMQDQAA